MSVAESLKKSLLGDTQNQVIKAGTLVTTRGTGVVAVGLILVYFLMDSLGVGPWIDLTPPQKLTFVLATGGIWAVVAAADAIARGIATGFSSPIVTLPAGLTASYTKGVDSPGWKVLALDSSGGSDAASLQFLIAKGDKMLWVPSSDVSFT